MNFGVFREHMRATPPPLFFSTFLEERTNTLDLKASDVRRRTADTVMIKIQQATISKNKPPTLAGSDVQRRIADAMAGVLAAGERAMSGTDASGASGGAIGSNRNHSGGGGGEGYREITDRGPPSARCVITSA